MRKIDLDAFFQVFEEIAPFHTLLDPIVQHVFFLGGRREPQGITHSHAGGLAKNRAPFHLAALALRQSPGFQ